MPHYLKLFGQTETYMLSDDDDPDETGERIAKAAEEKSVVRVSWVPADRLDSRVLYLQPHHLVAWQIVEVPTGSPGS